MKDVNALEFICFPTSQPGVYVNENERCFELWEKIWTATFQELNVHHTQLASDSYLSKELGGLFHKGKPVAFLLYHFCDVRLRSQQAMSYFTNYPEQVYKNIIALDQEIMIITFMTIDADWRKSNTELPLSEVLIGFAVLRFLESHAANLIGYFRNNRGTHNIFYRHGGIPILKSQYAYNVEVDFAHITRASAQLSTLPKCADFTLQKWNFFKRKKGGLHVNGTYNNLATNETVGSDFKLDGLGESSIL